MISFAASRAGGYGWPPPEHQKRSPAELTQSRGQTEDFRVPKDSSFFTGGSVRPAISLPFSFAVRFIGPSRRSASARRRIWCDAPAAFEAGVRCLLALSLNCPKKARHEPPSERHRKTYIVSRLLLLHHKFRRRACVNLRRYVTSREK